MDIASVRLRAVLLWPLLGLALGGISCGGSETSGTLAFDSPASGATFCLKDDQNPATAEIDVQAVLKSIDLPEGTRVVVENLTTKTKETQALAGGKATFGVALRAGTNQLSGHTEDDSVMAQPSPITVTADTTAPLLAVLSPQDGTILNGEDDVDHDLTNGFQYDIEVSADIEDGAEVELYVGGVLQQPAAAVQGHKATFPSVQLPSGTVTLLVNARNACGNEGSATANVTVVTGLPGCSIEGFTPAAVTVSGLGMVLNVSSDASSVDAGMQTTVNVKVDPAGGAADGLDVELWYNNGVQATAKTAADGTAAMPLDLPEGALELVAHCFDIAGNEGLSQRVNVFVDSEAPDCTLTLPKSSGLYSLNDDADANTDGVQINAIMRSTATDVGGREVTFLVNGTQVAGTKPTMGTGGTASQMLTIGPGGNTIEGTVSDRAQNTCSASKGATLITDGCTIDFVDPTPSQVLNIASDTQTGTAGLQYTVTVDVSSQCEGQAVTLQAGTLTPITRTVPSGGGTVTFTDATICSGPCQQQVTLTARVTDAAGNLTTKQLTVLADNVPPAATVTFFHPGGKVCGDTLTPATADQDPGTDGVQVDLLIATALDRQSLTVDVTNGGTTLSYSPSPATSNIVRITLGSGQNGIVAHVISATGNPGSSPVCSISLQDMLVVFTSPTEGTALGPSAGSVSGNTLTIDVAGTVDMGGAEVTLSVDGTAFGTTTASGNTWSFTGVPLTEGEHTLTADGTSGGLHGSTTITVRVDLTKPQSVANVTAAAVNRAAIRLTFTAPSDGGGSGVGSYDIRYATAPLNETNFAGAAPISPPPPTPGAPGSTEQMTATGFEVNASYYFGVTSIDRAGNRAFVAVAGPVALNFTALPYGVPSIGNLAAKPGLGYAVAGASVDGDAYPDLVVAAPSASFASATSNEGAVLVYLGGAAGLHAAPDYVIRGAVGNALTGQGLALLDFDGDGVTDLAIGAPGANAFAGAVHVCRGGARFALPASAPVVIDPAGCELTITRASPSVNCLGWSLAGADFDGDGADDLLIGAPGTGSFTGEAFLLYGAKPLPAAATLALPDEAASGAYRAWQLTFPGASGSPQWGSFVYGLDALQGAGDTTEDVGVAGTAADSAYVYYGRPRPAALGSITPSDSGVLTLSGGAGSEIGTGMAGIGDTDGDGFREIVAGAPGAAGGAGRVYVVNGGPTGTLAVATAPASRVPTVISGSAGERLGSSVANPSRIRQGGDLNGDGLVDLFVANTATPWRAYLFYGGPAGFGSTLQSSDSAWQFSPSGGDAAYGFVAVLPDMNGDGLPDLAAADWFSTVQIVTVLE